MRNELRFLSKALVYVIDESEKESEANLRDLSRHGLSIQTENYIDIAPLAPYVIIVIPEKETNMEKFQLEIESKWVKLNKTQMESGFSVMVAFDEKEFQDYLAYLAQKNETSPPPKVAAKWNGSGTTIPFQTPSSENHQNS